MYNLKWRCYNIICFMKYQLQRSQQLHCDLNTAWEFFSSPDNLSRITPPDMKFKVLTKFPEGGIFEGMRIRYKVAPLLKIPLSWTTIITQVNPKKSFTDFQEKGPYKVWNHYHEFIPNEAGVLMKDTVDYELPFGVLGTMAHTLFVRKKLADIFDFRFQFLEKMFNGKS